MKTQYNNELSIIDTEQKAYLLGLLYADGCITIGKGKKNKAYICRLSLTDKDIIQKLHKAFPFFNYEIFDFGKYGNNQKIQYALRKTSTKLFNDLKKNGLHERKSYQNKDLITLPNLKDHLISHFIRGYFDGDGSINISKKRPNLRRVEICSVTKELLLQFKQHLEKIGINCPIFREKSNLRIQTLYVLEWIKSEDILDLKHFLYNNSTLFIDRKKELFDSFIPIDKKFNNPPCILCNQEGCCVKRTARKMQYGTAYRYKCLNCNKCFTIPSPNKIG